MIREAGLKRTSCSAARTRLLVPVSPRA